MNFLGGWPITGLHGCACSLNIAVASFSLPAFFHARAQKQSAQVLFHRPRADIKMARAISLLLHPCTSTRNTLLVTGSYPNFVKVNHRLFVCSFNSVLGSRPAKTEASGSPNVR